MTRTTGTAAAVIWINLALEFLWLCVVVLVPLAFLGRSHGEWSSEIGSFELLKITILRTAAGLMVSLWLIKLALSSQNIGVLFTGAATRILQPISWPAGLRHWLRDQPVRWLILAVLIFLGSTLLSTFLSASFSVSMWGDIPGQDSYSTYTALAYLVVFAVIATHLKTRSQLWRLLAAIVVMGVLVAGYGISQHYDHDFLDLIQPPNTQRVSSTMGSSTFVGALLLMTIPLSVMLATMGLKWSLPSRRFWVMLGLWVPVIAVQLLGMAFTLTRGPWVGTGMALVGLLVLVAVFVDWRQMARATLALGLALAITAIVLVLPTGAGINSAKSTDDTAASVVTGRIKDVAQHTFSGGVGGRVDIWKGSWQLITDRPWFGLDSLSLTSLRPVIGYGPDFFRATYLLESPSRFRMLPSEPAHAHNYFIHQGVELGVLGVLGSLGVFAAVFSVGGFRLLRARRGYSTAYQLVLAVLLATIAGRFLEQMIGVARVSDLTIFWVLLGTFAALPIVMGDRAVSVDGPTSSGRPRLRSTGFGFKNIGILEKWPILIRIGAVCLVVGVGVLTWTKSINYLRAGLIADQGAQHFRDGRLQEAMASLDHAIDLAPDVSSYYTSRATVYAACRQSSQAQLVSEASTTVGGPNFSLCQPEKQYRQSQQWVEMRPFNFRSRLALADSARDLGLLTQDDALNDMSTRLYHEVAEMLPSSWPLWNRLAEVHIQVGQPSLALAPLEKSLGITGNTELSFDALLLQARAYHSLGQLTMAIGSAGQAILQRPESAEGHYIRGTSLYSFNKFREALHDLDQAIQLDPQHSLAFNIRGLSQARLGRLDLAVEDFGQAVRFNPRSATAYNNRGFAYRDLGDLDRAIEDLDQATELDPQLAIAYYNRALAYALLGDDSKSQQDGRVAVELGFDPISLEAAMAEIKSRSAPD